MSTTEKVFCYECYDKVSYETYIEERLGTLKNEKFKYNRKVARCLVCKEELDVYKDENVKALFDAYRVKHGLIPLENVRAIPKIYNIGKRNLSLLLGWGENTFTRYYDGYLPTKQYSDVLTKLHDNPLYFSEILDNNIVDIGDMTIYAQDLLQSLKVEKSKIVT